MTIDLAAHDCEAQMLSRLPAYMNRQRWRELIGVIASEIQEIDDAIVAVTFQLHLDNAAGAQLDLIGHELNEERGGREDADYRHAIEIRVAVNRSRGLAEDVIRVARLVVNDVAKTVELQTTGIASASLAIGGTAGTASDEAALLTAYARTAIDAGVRLLVTTSEAPDEETFRFSYNVGSVPRIDLTATTGGDVAMLLSAKLYGAIHNGVVTMAVVADAGAPNAGTWAAGFPNFVFQIKDGVTTIANFGAAITADQSAYLEYVDASPPGVFVDGVNTFSVALVGAEDDPTNEPGLGFEGTPPVISLGAYLGNGYNGVVGYRVFGADYNSTRTLEFVHDAGAPNAGDFDESDPIAIVFTFKGGTTNTDDFEAAIATSEYLYIDTPDAPVTFNTPGDAVGPLYFLGAAGDPGGHLASVQE